jgi:4-amino-4-deoxy-L-arabinose transferase-like glycosyltransferase
MKSLFLLVVLASAAAWGILISAIPPDHQNFPLMDDWAFANGAMLFAQGRGIHYGNWASMPQLGIWIWAAPFLWIFGNSFFALRLATIALSWLGLWSFYDILRQGNVAALRATLATATLAFNPLFFLLQGTFMTDVPTLSLALLALALYGRSVRHSSSLPSPCGRGAGGEGELTTTCHRPLSTRLWPLGASLVATLAAISRQNMLVVPIVAAILLCREQRPRASPGCWISVLVPLVIGGITYMWFNGRQDIIPVNAVLLPPDRVLMLPYTLLLLAGMSALPLLVVSTGIACWKTLCGVLILLAANAAYWWSLDPAMSDMSDLFPYTPSGTLLTAWGPFASVWGDFHLFMARWLRVILTLLGCVTAAVLVTKVLMLREFPIFSPLVLFSLFQVPFLLIAPDVWDRYLLVLIPTLLALAVWPAVNAEENLRRSTPQTLAALCSLLALAVLSVCLMHDWLAWNAARWELGRRALDHVGPLDIEGGLEWDGWYDLQLSGEGRRRTWEELFGRAVQRGPSTPHNLTLQQTRVWFPAVRGRLALSFSHEPNTVVIDQEPYHLWLVPGQHAFLLLGLP